MDKPTPTPALKKTLHEHFYFDRRDWKRFAEAVEARDALVEEAAKNGEGDYIPIKFHRNKNGWPKADAQSDTQPE